MMGKDVERLLTGLDNIKKDTMKAIISLANSSSYQIQSREQHAGTGVGTCTPLEMAVPAVNLMSAISATSASISKDYSTMNSLNKKLFTNSKGFNNSIGSPWTELSQLKEAINAGVLYTSTDYVGQKAGLLSILNMILSCTVDAKSALITYHDYVQRGYDHNFNGKKPSITFKTGIGRKTNGNLYQDYDENVNLPKKSIDPF